MHPVDVFIAPTGSYIIHITTSISIGNVVELKLSSLFKINVSYIESADFQALVHSVWKLIPCLRGITDSFYGGS
jgi:hypothetical protein